MSGSKFKIGFTTGVHATSALKAGLIACFAGNYNEPSLELLLPDGEVYELPIAGINIKNNSISVEVIKSDNDDIDATKGCKIICKIAKKNSDLNFKKHFVDHKPYLIGKNLQLEIFAGKGLGVVTKPGLKPPVGYPAINPVPLGLMEQVVEDVAENFNVKNEKLYVVFEVENGEDIAKNTANQKVGVIGGISFLGQKGIVKPVSSEAYLASLEQEFNVAAANSESCAVLTMGNTSLSFAKKYYENLSDECFVEIGNYVYDSLSIIKDKSINKVSIVANIGKMTKIAQGKENTNNRFGDIDFNIIKKWLEQDNIININDENISEFLTMKGIVDYIQSIYPEKIGQFYLLIAKNAVIVLKNWASLLGISHINFEVIITDGEILKAKSES